MKNLRVDADRLRVLARGSASPVVSSALERLAAGEAEAVVLEQLQASEPQRVD
ncbi:MAG: hypothetical protein U0271_44395 [Polyangiaceae bacterium]